MGEPRLASTPLSAGVVIESSRARYRLDRPLGEGGMGEVWAASDLDADAPRALKFLKRASATPDRLRRFEREARAAAAIDHPNVVRIHDVAVSADGDPFLVMDLLEGETVRGLLDRQGAFSLGEALGLLVPIVSAVGAAHESGVVHRDIKPENVFLLSDGTVKVLDFGVAKMIAKTDSLPLTESGDRLGTPRYMSPEQARGRRDVDHRADIWSLGILFHEMLTGRHPIAGENVGTIYRAITFDPIPDPPMPLPDDVRALLSAMLAKEPEQRPRDLREVLAVLERHSSLPVPKFGPPRAPERESRSSVSTVDDSVAAPPKRRSRALWFVAALALALISWASYRLATGRVPATSASP